ncbi:glycosyltransferase [Zavarzinella formosa]|uniref:glycosyltransferase n=1 Tax=Zavarzinella formosa TaxID=360055 RepID=UPI0002E65932|nr:nucleotide disphospho-sugar-binding domain-containing protein [Zavarzinella formosa]
MTKNILLFPMGSSGDVHPFIGLGRALRKRGHRVTLFSCEYFGETAAKSGLEFEETYSTEEYHQIQEDPDLWHPRRGMKAVLDRTQTVDGYGKCLERIKEKNIPGETVLVGGSLALGPRIARDHLKIPLVTLHLQPSVIVSPISPPRMAAGKVPRWWPLWMRRLAYRFGEKYMVDPMLAPKVNEFRRGLGLPPVRNIISQYWHSPDAVVGLFPEWYANPAADWPANLRLASFPLYDEANVRGLTDEQQRFFDAGDPPIIVTFGTAMRHAKPYFTAAAEAISKLGRRGVLLTPYREQIPDPLPRGVIHADYIPLSQILPRSAVMIHHGGIGTAAQTLKAGIPHLVMPMTHDQPDNAVRLQNLGLGTWLSPKQFKPVNVARELAWLLTKDSVKTAAKQAAERLAKEDGLTTAAEIVEQVVWK